MIRVQFVVLLSDWHPFRNSRSSLAGLAETAEPDPSIDPGFDSTASDSLNFDASTRSLHDTNSTLNKHNNVHDDRKNWNVEISDGKDGNNSDDDRALGIIDLGDGDGINGANDDLLSNSQLLREEEARRQKV